MNILLVFCSKCIYCLREDGFILLLYLIRMYNLKLFKLNYLLFVRLSKYFKQILLNYFLFAL